MWAVIPWPCCSHCGHNAQQFVLLLPISCCSSSRTHRSIPAGQCIWYSGHTGSSYQLSPLSSCILDTDVVKLHTLKTPLIHTYVTETFLVMFSEVDKHFLTGLKSQNLAADSSPILASKNSFSDGVSGTV